MTGAEIIEALKLMSAVAIVCVLIWRGV